MTAPQIEPDAPAEVLFRKVEVDDRDFPRERVTREYIRFKVFQPEHVAAITRLAAVEVSGSALMGLERKVKILGRLTLPDRTEKIFGEESIRERNVAQSGAERSLLERLLGGTSVRLKERFLAVSGVEAGAVLEYRTETSEPAGSVRGFGLQSSRMGVRQLEYQIRSADPGDWHCSYFVLNKSIGNVSLDVDKKKSLITITGTNLPALHDEPLMAPSVAYYGLFFLFSYDQLNEPYLARKPGFGANVSKVDPRKTGPWSLFATRRFLRLDDRVELTARIRQLASEVTAGADGSLEKARRIHRRVQTLYARFREESKLNKTKVDFSTLDWYSRTLDDLLVYDRNSKIAGLGADDYIALAIALYRAAGLECKAITLPDRRKYPFGRNVVTTALLPVLAVGVRAQDEWHYSIPIAWPPLAFGALPWFCEGKSGLWVQAGNEEFEQVPLTGPEKSMISNGGSYELSADGALAGEGTRRYTGHAAETLRGELFDRDERGRRVVISRRLNSFFRLPGAETPASDAAEEPAAKTDENPDLAAGLPVTITKISGVDDCEAPIEISYQLHLPGFAVVTANRIIFRANPFRLNSRTPFTASTRKLDVWFPYAWEELDVATIKLPTDGRPEFTEIPTPQPNKNLYYASQLRYNMEKQQLKLRREFACSVITFPAGDYAGLKAWYEEMTRGDQQEVVLTKEPASAEAAPSTQ